MKHAATARWDVVNRRAFKMTLSVILRGRRACVFYHIAAHPTTSSSPAYLPISPRLRMRAVFFTICWATDSMAAHRPATSANDSAYLPLFSDCATDALNGRAAY